MAWPLLERRYPLFRGDVGSGRGGERRGGRLRGCVPSLVLPGVRGVGLNSAHPRSPLPTTESKYGVLAPFDICAGVAMLDLLALLAFWRHENYGQASSSSSSSSSSSVSATRQPRYVCEGGRDYHRD